METINESNVEAPQSTTRVIEVQNLSPVDRYAIIVDMRRLMMKGAVNDDERLP